MYFFSTLLFPIETLLKSILDFSLSLSKNHGVAIILLSLGVNLILLPVYILAEKLQEKEQRIKSQMQDKLTEIKEVFSGQEQFMMTQTLYRIHRYHPIMGLRALTPLLVQIPFFFAAYNLLKHYAAFEGISFLFINNLLLQDALIPFGRYHINVLPLVMTAINIIAAQIYTLRKNPQALMSTWTMALVFLVLLYQSPAALVLYWTCNNIFSLSKNLVMRMLDTAKIATHINVAAKTSMHNKANVSADISMGIEASHNASTGVEKNIDAHSVHGEKKFTVKSVLAEKAVKLFSNDSKLRSIIAILWAMAGYFLLAYVLVPNNRTRGTVPNMLLNIAAIILVISGVLLFAYRFYKTSSIYRGTHNGMHENKSARGATLMFRVLCLLALVSFFAGLFLLLRYIYVPEHLVTVSTVLSKIFALCLLSFPNALMLPWFVRDLLATTGCSFQNYHKRPPWFVRDLLATTGAGIDASTRYKRTKKTPSKSATINFRQLFVLLLISISALSMLIFISLPADIFSSAPEQAGIAFSKVLQYNLLKYVLSCVAIIGLYLVMPKKLKYFYVLIVTVTSAVLLSYALLIPFDLGRMDYFKLIFPQNIVPKIGSILLDIIIILALFYILHKQMRGGLVYVTLIMAIFHVIVFLPLFDSKLWKNSQAVSLAASSNANASASANASSNAGTDVADGIPESSKELLSFSSTGKNVVVFLLDMVNGGYVQKAVEEMPDMKATLKGFTWYPNTLSISTFTTPSKPSLMAGWEYSPTQISHIQAPDTTNSNLAQKVIQSYDTMFDTFASHGYSVGVTGMSYYTADVAQCKILEARNIACLDYWDNSYIGYWLEHTQKTNVSSVVLAPQKKTALLTSAGLLRAVPIAFKQFVYDEGNWNLYLSEFKNQEAYNYAIKEWAFLDSIDSLSRIADVDSNLAEGIASDAKNTKHASDTAIELENTFKFIHTGITHRPYALTESCELRNDVFPDEAAGNDFEGLASYYSFACSLKSIARWTAWLKAHNIYDNTKIILVSDHGNDFADDPMNINHIAPDLMGGKSEHSFSRAHVLLMVKDFGSQGDLKIDQRFMSNADTASIMYHSIEGYKASPTSHPRDALDPTKTLFENVSLPIYHTKFYNWVDLVKEESNFEVVDEYRVKDNIFFEENWEKIK